MSTWYIAGETGSDSNSGLTAAAPRKTLPANASVTTGDTFNLAENIRGANGVAAENYYPLKSALTFQQWDGQPQARMRGDTPISGTWSAATNGWSINIGAGLTIDHVLYDWDNSEDSRGRRKAFLISGTLASVTSATGSKGRYNYNSGTGVLTVYLGGADPNTSGKEVAYCICTGKILIHTEGSGHRFTDINFGPMPGNGQCYGIRCDTSTDCVIRNCPADDMGYHGHGFYQGATANDGNHIIDCNFNGLRHDGTYTVHYQDGAAGAMTDCSVIGCHFEAHRYFDLDGVELSGLSAMGQTGIYAHSTSGTNIADLLVDGCSSYGAEAGFIPVGAANIPTPSDLADWSTYPIRTDRCSFIFTGSFDFAVYQAIRRTVYKQLGPCPTGYGGRGAINLGWDGGSTNRTILMEACAFNFDLDELAGAATQGFTVAVAGGTAQFRFTNCTFWNRGANYADRRNFLDYRDSNTKFFIARGCVFGHAGTGSFTGVASNCSGTSAANMDIVDCAYWNMTLYSMRAASDTSAEWTATIDANAQHLGATPFPAAPASFTLTRSSSLWAISRATSAVLPSEVLGGPYASKHGAYQPHRAPSAGLGVATAIRIGV